MENIFIRHVAGEYKNLKQHCIVCGAELCNYENAMWASPYGFKVGEIFERNSGGGISFQSELKDGKFTNCK